LNVSQQILSAVSVVMSGIAHQLLR
jgi:hypothetical protein